MIEKNLLLNFLMDDQNWKCKTEDKHYKIKLFHGANVTNLKKKFNFYFPKRKKILTNLKEAKHCKKHDYNLSTCEYLRSYHMNRREIKNKTEFRGILQAKGTLVWFSSRTWKCAGKQEEVKHWDLNDAASVHWESRGCRRTEDITGDCQRMMTAKIRRGPSHHETETSVARKNHAKPWPFIQYRR